MKPTISRRFAAILVSAVLLLVASTIAVAGPGNRTSAAADDDPIDATLLGVTPSWLVVENRKPRTSAWRIRSSAAAKAAGLADHVSAQLGDRVRSFVWWQSPHLHVEGCRF